MESKAQILIDQLTEVLQYIHEQMDGMTNGDTSTNGNGETPPPTNGDGDGNTNGDGMEPPPEPKPKGRALQFFGFRPVLGIRFFQQVAQPKLNSLEAEFKTKTKNIKGLKIRDIIDTALGTRVITFELGNRFYTLRMSIAPRRPIDIVGKDAQVRIMLRKGTSAARTFKTISDVVKELKNVES